MGRLVCQFDKFDDRSRAECENVSHLPTKSESVFCKAVPDIATKCLVWPDKWTANLGVLSFRISGKHMRAGTTQEPLRFVINENDVGMNNLPMNYLACIISFDIFSSASTIFGDASFCTKFVPIHVS